MFVEAKAIEEILKVVNAGNVWIGFLIFFVVYILKKEPFKVIVHLAEKRDKEFDFVKGLLESDKLGKEAADLLREYLERESFKRMFGVSPERDMRAAVHKFHQKYHSKIKWVEIQRAFPYFRLDGSKLTVKLGKADAVMAFITTALSVIVGAFSLFVIVVSLYWAKVDESSKWIVLSMFGSILLLASMVFSSLNWPYSGAKKIKEVLASNAT